MDVSPFGSSKKESLKQKGPKDPEIKGSPFVALTKKDQNSFN